MECYGWSLILFVFFGWGVILVVCVCAANERKAVCVYAFSLACQKQLKLKSGENKQLVSDEAAKIPIRSAKNIINNLPS